LVADTSQSSELRPSRDIQQTPGRTVVKTPGLVKIKPVRDLRLLPKAHLHTHLESTVRAGTIRDLGGMPLAEDRPFTSFREFADRRATVRALLRDRQHFRRIAEEFCEEEAAQGVRYAEVTFTAAAHGERLDDLEMPLEGVLAGLAAGAERYGIQTRVILDHSRRRPAERLWRTVELAGRYPQVIAIGLAGDEAYPAAPFAEVLRAAREAGLHQVHHAGETSGPASIWEVLTVGHAERIGHGIRVLEDPRLVAELRTRRIPLEVCPTSNVLLGLVPALADHPLPRLVEAGLLVTVNTDGETPLAAEYERAREVFGCADTELASLARASVEASYAPAELKAQISTAIEQWLQT
jgi:adenosine deaminase